MYVSQSIRIQRICYFGNSIFLDQVCMLNIRLAAAESMTHDVIRDLLGVKLDMTNYAVSSDSYIHK